MAKPARSVPDSATNTEPERPREGREAIEAVIEEYGGDYADVADHTEELESVIETTVLVMASADDDDVEYITESVVTLVQAADGLSSEGTVALAEGLGENAEGFADLLEDVVRLQEEGHLSMFIDLAETLAEPLDDDDAERLANTVGENADAIADLLDRVMAMEERGELDDLLDLASTLSALDVDEDTARGLNGVLSAVGEAEEESEPVGLLGLFGALSGKDARSGLGYVVEILKGIGSRVR